MKVFSKAQWEKVSKYAQESKEFLKDIPEKHKWWNMCEGKTAEEIEGMGYRWEEEWMVEKKTMKKIFSAKKWEEDNADLKENCKWLYDLARLTYVQDCDGEEVVNGKVKGKSGAEYTITDICGGVLEETPELEQGYEKPENPEKPVPYEIVITCDGKTTQAVMKVNGKAVRESSARKCPEDKFDFKVGAEFAFNRLFGKERKVYKVGDVVRIRKNLRVNENEDKSEYDGCFVTSDMKNYFGKKAKIIRIHSHDENRYRVEVDGKNVDWWWTAEMFENKPSFEAGDRVILHGLVRNTDLNGKHGRVVGFEKDVPEDMKKFLHTTNDPELVTIRLDKIPKDGFTLRNVFVDKIKHE